MSTRTMWRLLVCSECGELDEDQQECGFCGSSEGVTMVDVVAADEHERAAKELEAAFGILRGLSEMPLRATGREFDPLVKMARELLPEWGEPS